MIVTLFEGLTETGAVAKTQDLGGNLLYWMSLVFVNSTSNAQRFSMIGTPLTVFDRDYTEGVLCDCSVLTSAELSDSSHNCNVFRFLAGFVYLNSLEDSQYLFGLLDKHSDSVANVNRGAHQAMFIASTFASYDENPTNWAVSQYYYQVENGACHDTLTPSVSNWTRLYETPYAPLNQNYERCNNQVFQTIVNQAGIAIGDLEILAPFVIIFIFMLNSIHKRFYKVPLDESYSKGEKDSALDAFAMSMLLARDAHLKTAKYHDKDSIVAQIAEELSEHT
eukprot:gene47475-biopygen32379